MLTINTKESVLAILNNPGGSTQKFPHSRIINRMLQAMYARQTRDEQAMAVTVHNNGVGFSGRDSEFLSDVAAKTAKKGDFWTPKQAAAVAKCLTHYTAQLIEIATEKIAAAPAKQMPLIAVAPVPMTVVAPRKPAAREIETVGQISSRMNQQWAQHKVEFAKRERQQEEKAFMDGLF